MANLLSLFHVPNKMAYLEVIKNMFWTGKNLAGLLTDSAINYMNKMCLLIIIDRNDGQNLVMLAE